VENLKRTVEKADHPFVTTCVNNSYTCTPLYWRQHTLRYTKTTFGNGLFFLWYILLQFWWMKFFSLFRWLKNSKAAGQKKTKAQVLRQQHMLLHHGLETTAEVMDAVLQNSSIGDMLLVKLWLKLKKTDGSFSYTHTQTLLSLRNLPGKGQLLRIKYLPEDLSSVVIV
jgi:hypothetical protein